MLLVLFLLPQAESRSNLAIGVSLRSTRAARQRLRMGQLCARAALHHLRLRGLAFTIAVVVLTIYAVLAGVKPTRFYNGN